MVKNIIIAMLLIALAYTGYRWQDCESVIPAVVEQPIEVREERKAPSLFDTTTVRDTAEYLIPETVVPNYSDSTREEVKPKRGLIDKVLGKRENSHRVQEGENLYRIALKYNTTWPKLMELNPSLMSANDIKAGDWIYIGTVAERYVPPSDSTLASDSTYYYDEYYGNDTLNATVKTASYGPLISQSVEINYKPTIIERRRNLVYVGGGLGSDLSAGAGLGYKTKEDRFFNVEYRISPYAPPSINVRAYVPVKWKD